MDLLTWFLATVLGTVAGCILGHAVSRKPTRRRADRIRVRPLYRHDPPAN